MGKGSMLCMLFASSALGLTGACGGTEITNGDAALTRGPIRGRFESTGPITTCRGAPGWNAPDGPLIRIAFNTCGDDMVALAETIVGALNRVLERGDKAILAIGQGTLLPPAWLARCQRFHLTGSFTGDICVPWDASYQTDLREALANQIGPRVKGHPALVGTYLTTPTMTNAYEMHFRVSKSAFTSATAYPGDAGLQEAYRAIMDIYQQAFDVPIVFEAGHCLWSSGSYDCQTPLMLYRHSRDTYGVGSSGISLWNCAERFWAGATVSNSETFGAKALIEEASRDGASIGCQTVGSFTNGACRFSDPRVGDYGTNDAQPRDVCPMEAKFNPVGACVDTMRWFAGVERKASPTAHVAGTWAENWSADHRPTGVYQASGSCMNAIDLLAR